MNNNYKYILDKFTNPPTESRSIFFWSWNDNLDKMSLPGK